MVEPSAVSVIAVLSEIRSSKVYQVIAFYLIMHEVSLFLRLQVMNEQISGVFVITTNVLTCLLSHEDFFLRFNLN